MLEGFFCAAVDGVKLGGGGLGTAAEAAFDDDDEDEEEEEAAVGKGAVPSAGAWPRAAGDVFFGV